MLNQPNLSSPADLEANRLCKECVYILAPIYISTHTFTRSDFDGYLAKNKALKSVRDKLRADRLLKLEQEEIFAKALCDDQEVF